MRLTRSFLVPTLISLALCGATTRLHAVDSAPRIVASIDDNSLVTLKGNTHPLANAKNDRGRVSPDLPMTDLIMVLSRSPQQQAAFDRMVASQYDPQSQNYHQWLTPEEVGADFGPSPADIAAIAGWLKGHGFAVNEVTNDRMSIRFSGAAANVESAFHTEIHNLEVKGVAHIGNMSDPKIPAALAPVVVGVKSLHNFFARPMHRTGSKVTLDAASHKWKRTDGTDSAASTTTDSRTRSAHPQFGVNVPASGNSNAYLVEDVAPYDFATIYNILPLWNASSAIDGTGQTIAIAGTSDIVMGDVTTFRSTFGLPAYTSANQPTVVSGNSQPLTVCTSTDTTALCTIDDLIENSLDVEWAGAVAKGANIVLVASYPASSSDDNLYDSESYIVDNKTASIMNVSYGLCELYNGTAGNVQYYNLWQTAATEGIAVFVSAGDGGAAECDDGGDAIGNPYSAQGGLSVNGLASTPYNTAVGGTDFNWCAPDSTTECTASPYWNSSNASNGSSAAGYVPEVPWNDTCANPLAVGLLEEWANSSDANGVGGVTNPESACNFVYNYWQTVQTNTGGSGSGVDLAYFIDTYGGGGGASNCVANDSNDVSSCTSSTTTTGTANGSIALAADGWPKPSWQAGVTGIPSDKVRDIPDVSFFASDGFLSYSAYLICVSDVAACTYSTTSEPTAQEVGGTSVSSPAMAGIMALINQKAGGSQGSPNTELYRLAANQTYSKCSAETATTSNGCYFNDIDTNTIAMPCDYGAEEGFPEQTGIVSPNCSVSTSGDLVGILSGYSAATGYDQATGLGSLNVANVVNAWPSTSTLAKATVTVTPASATVSAGTALVVAVKVAPATTGGTTPTGTVTISGGGYTSAAEALSGGTYSFTIPANSLAAGSDTLTVSYSGDTNYASTTGTASVTVTSTLAAATVTVTPASSSISVSSSLTVAVTVASSTSGGTTPTGTVTLSGGGYTSSAESLTSGAYAFTIPANSLTAGTDTLTVSYSGDTNYGVATGTASVTVTAAALPTPTVTVTPASSTLAADSSLSVAVTVASSTSGATTPTGTVTLSGGGYTSSAQTLASGASTFTIPANSLTTGTDTLTVSYSGDTNYTAATGTASVTVTAASSSATFTLSASTPSSVSPGTPATSTVTVASTDGYVGTATLSCSLTSSPSGATDAPTCTIATPSVSLTSSSTSGAVTVTVNSTAASTSSLVRPDSPRPGNHGKDWLGGGAVLAFLVFLGIPSRRRAWRSMVGALALIAVLGGLSACGDFWQAPGGSSGSGTTAGNYTFTVTGSGAPAVSSTVSTTFTLTVN